MSIIHREINWDLYNTEHITTVGKYSLNFTVDWKPDGTTKSVSVTTYRVVPRLFSLLLLLKTIKTSKKKRK